jgi:rhodanese-related sulfurtransferase/predicted transcriptional regulator
MSERSMRAELFGQFARLGRALGSPSRLELIYLLNQGAKTVERLARESHLTVANVSQHLQQLKAARLVVSEKQGQHVRYRLASESVAALWQCLQRIGEERLLEVRELVENYIERRDELEPVSREELLERMARKKVIVLDVRPADEFAAGHLPQAVSIPLGELEARLRELPADREVVAYCRGPYCLLAFEAVERLRAKGFRALRLEGGFPEWKALRLPIESGAASADARA